MSRLSRETTSPRRLAKKSKSALGPGKSATYTVARAGGEEQLTATLSEVPREVLAQWVGEHVLEHTGEQVAAK